MNCAKKERRSGHKNHLICEWINKWNEEDNNDVVHDLSF